MTRTPILRAAALPLAAAVLLAAAGSPKPGTAIIHVIANDYAFITPDAARPGPTTFTFKNRGGKLHEMFIGLLRPGAGSAEIVAAHQKGVNFRQLPDLYLDGGPSVALMAWPGKTSDASALVDLLAGRSYIIFCQLRDSLGMPQHAALGMFRILRVE